MSARVQTSPTYLTTDQICRSVCAAQRDIELLSVDYGGGVLQPSDASYPVILRTRGFSPDGRDAETVGREIAARLGCGVRMDHLVTPPGTFAAMTMTIVCDPLRDVVIHASADPEREPLIPVVHEAVTDDLANAILQQLGFPSKAQPSAAEVDTSHLNHDRDRWFEAHAPNAVRPAVDSIADAVQVTLAKVAHPHSDPDLDASLRWVQTISSPDRPVHFRFRPTRDQACRFLYEECNQSVFWNVDALTSGGCFRVTLQPRPNPGVPPKERSRLEAVIHLALGSDTIVVWSDHLIGKSRFSHQSSAVPYATALKHCKNDIERFTNCEAHHWFVTDVRQVGTTTVIEHLDTGVGIPFSTILETFSGEVVVVPPTRGVSIEGLGRGLVDLADDLGLGQVEIREENGALAVYILDSNLGHEESDREYRARINDLKDNSRLPIPVQIVTPEFEDVYNYLLARFGQFGPLVLTATQSRRVLEVRSTLPFRPSDITELEGQTVLPFQLKYASKSVVSTQNGEEPLLTHPGTNRPRTITKIALERTALQGKLTHLLPCEVERQGTALVATVPSYVPPDLIPRIEDALAHHDAAITVTCSEQLVWTEEAIAQALPQAMPHGCYLRDFALHGRRLTLSCFFDPEHVDRHALQQSLGELSALNVVVTLHLVALSSEAAQVFRGGSPRFRRILGQVLLDDMTLRDDVDYDHIQRQITAPLVPNLPFRSSNRRTREEISEPAVAFDDSCFTFMEDLFSAKRLADGSIRIQCHHISANFIPRGSEAEFHIMEMPDAAYPYSHNGTNGHSKPLIDRKLVSERLRLDRSGGIPAGTVEFVISPKGEITGQRIFASYLRSVARFTREVFTYPSEVTDPQHQEVISLLLEATERREEFRHKGNSYDPILRLGTDAGIAAARSLRSDRRSGVFVTDQRRGGSDRLVGWAQLHGGHGTAGLSFPELLRHALSLGARPTLDLPAQTRYRQKEFSSTNGDRLALGGTYRHVLSLVNGRIVEGEDVSPRELNRYIAYQSRHDAYHDQPALEQTILLEIVAAGQFIKSGESIAGQWSTATEVPLVAVPMFARAAVPYRNGSVPSGNSGDPAHVQIVNFHPLDRTAVVRVLASKAALE